jgi:hypothetical protein
LLQIPGKRIRSKLIDAFDIWLKIPAAIKTEIKGFFVEHLLFVLRKT